jgi:hypothetical protein
MPRSYAITGTNLLLDSRDPNSCWSVVVHTMASSAGDCSTAEWQVPLNGSPCWIEIPGRDLEKQKVCSISFR